MALLTTSSRRFVVAAAFFFSAVVSLCAESWEATVTPFTPGSFPELRPARAHYRFGWSGFTAANIVIRLEKLSDGQFRFKAEGGTVGLARSLWKFDVHHTAFSDARTLRPIEVREVESARAKVKTTEVKYSPAGVVSVREEKKGSAVKVKTRRFDFPNVLSLNSALLFLRTQPLPDGAVRRVVVYPATSAYLCTITVLGREPITVPTGSYQAIKVDVRLSKIGPNRELLPHKKFRKATVWLSDDTDRLPLRIEAQIFIGTVFAELESVQFNEKTEP